MESTNKHFSYKKEVPSSTRVASNIQPILINPKSSIKSSVRYPITDDIYDKVLEKYKDPKERSAYKYILKHHPILYYVHDYNLNLSKGIGDTLHVSLHSNYLNPIEQYFIDYLDSLIPFVPVEKATSLHWDVYGDFYKNNTYNF